MSDVPESARPSAALAQWLREQYEQGAPPRIEAEAVRCLLNGVGAGIGGTANPAVSRLMAAGRKAWGPGEAFVLGHAGERLHPYASAVVNAFAVTQDDFDDAHAATIVHPAAASIAGLLSVAGEVDVTGSMLLAAFALGCEAQLSVAGALSPSHYERGWHTSATTAAVGAATTAGLLVDLDVASLANALDLAMLRVVGLREAHGTLMKGYQVGKGAAHGVRAVAEARTMSLRNPAIIGVGDVARSLSNEGDDRAVPVIPAGEQWELLRLTYKPYPAGIVCCSGIEAALDASRSIASSDIDGIRLRVAPLVIELAGDASPATEMQARVSLPHGVAAALRYGRAGLPQFSQAAIDDPDVVDLRGRVVMVADEEVSRSAAILEIDAADGQTHTWRIDEPRGAPDRPLSDEDLRAKVAELVAGVDAAATDAVIDATVGLAAAPDAAVFLGAVTLGEVRR